MRTQQRPPEQRSAAAAVGLRAGCTLRMPHSAAEGTVRTRAARSSALPPPPPSLPRYARRVSSAEAPPPPRAPAPPGERAVGRRERARGPPRARAEGRRRGARAATRPQKPGAAQEGRASAASPREPVWGPRARAGGSGRAGLGIDRAPGPWPDRLAEGLRERGLWKLCAGVPHLLPGGSRILWAAGRGEARRPTQRPLLTARPRLAGSRRASPPPPPRLLPHCGDAWAGVPALWFLREHPFCSPPPP